MEKFVIDLTSRRCSCYFWELVGIPCRHAIVVIKREAYKACYGPKISPINEQE